MLQFTPTNYNGKEVKLLYNTLLTGITLNTPDCDGNCPQCAFHSACDDIHSVLHQIEIMLLKDK